MDKELKAKWVAALRSGKFSQGKGALQTKGGGNCCLGVLCRVAGYGIDAANDYALRPDGTRGDLTYAVFDELGVTPARRHPLISMNDRGKSFGEIADYIEREL